MGAAACPCLGLRAGWPGDRTAEGNLGLDAAGTIAGPIGAFGPPLSFGIIGVPASRGFIAALGIVIGEFAGFGPSRLACFIIVYTIATGVIVVVVDWTGQCWTRGICLSSLPVSSSASALTSEPDLLVSVSPSSHSSECIS